MPLNAGDPGYGSVAAGAASGPPGGTGGSETAPLLIPEDEPERVSWRPMTKEELEAAAGGPGWRKVRSRLVLLFWLAWLAMLGTSIAVIMKSPRPVATPLQWWQKSLFYQLQPGLFMDAQTEGPGYVSGLKVVLDLCELSLFGPQNPAGNDTDDVPPEFPGTMQYALRFWLEQGVAGFAICDTDAAYSEKTLLQWRVVIQEFSREEEERIVVVKQTGDFLPALNTSSFINGTLVDVVMRSILPPTHHILSAEEVAVAIETHLQITKRDIWPSWMVGGKASNGLQKLLLMLMMTLPGSPAVQYGEEISHVQIMDQEKAKHSALALFTSLSHSRAREEALLYGSFTFLPFTTTSLSSSNSTLATPSSPPPILAFLRSWGCVHFLVVLNIGPEPHVLDPAWAPSLPDAGVFVTSTGMNRLGTTALDTLKLQPREAVVIKLFEAGSYS
ncbi:amino acid transporter heavy chain SLC3A2 [Polymixia lowei]